MADAGTIAVLPKTHALHTEAVEQGGGTVAPLSDETGGIVWTGGDTAELGRALDEHAGIRWVQLPSAGVEHYSEVFAAHGDRVTFTSAKGSYARPVAEHALALTFALARVLEERARETSWSTEQKGTTLYGAEVLILGAGGIALEYLRLLEPFGTTFTVVRRTDEPVEGAHRTVTADRLDEVLPEADVVMVAAAMTQGTDRLFDARRLGLMKPTAFLVNIARGGLIDTDALVDALTSGGIAGAGLDVTDPEPLPDGHPLWSVPTALITPHQANTDEMARPFLAERIADNTRAFAGDGAFVGVVDTDAGY